MNQTERLKKVTSTARIMLKANGIQEVQYSADDAAQDIWMQEVKTQARIREIYQDMEDKGWPYYMLTQTPDRARLRKKSANHVSNCAPRFIGRQTQYDVIDIMRVKFGRGEKKGTKVGSSTPCGASDGVDKFYDKNGAEDMTLIGIENDEFLNKCKKLLNPSERECFFNRYYSGESFLQVGVRLGISNAMAHRHYKSALRKIQESDLVKNIIR